MKLAIIADDLTGANDSGVQLARHGLKTSVLIRMEPQTVQGQDAIVIDTDSRSVSREEAYRRVKAASEFIRSHQVDIIYKKIDSTMRGNIGAEIDAVYDTFQPDFVVIAPAYPQNGRKIVKGLHYLNNRLLHETEVAIDPKTPVKESFLPKLLKRQTERPIELITCEELRSGADHLNERLKRFRHSGIPYLMFDSESESDLQKIVEALNRTDYKIVWAGSAGLVNYLPIPVQRQAKEDIFTAAPQGQSVLLVVGSVSPRTRRQLALLLSQPDIEGIVLQSDLLVSGEVQRRQEISRACEEALEVLSRKKHLALYSSGEPEDVKKAMEVGRSHGLNPTLISNLISEALGETAVRVLEQIEVKGIVVTGGDTAKQVCTRLGAERFELINEVETGVPIGRLLGKKEIYAVTKAGGFGTEQALLNSIRMLKGEKCV